jgi:drug/metabolite transporter (DMT)-like permease
MPKTMPPLFFALFLPILTGITCAYYERIVVKSGFTWGVYFMVINLLSCIPVFFWCLYKKELKFKVIGSSISNNLWLLLFYAAICVVLSFGWWYCTKYNGVTIGAAFEASYPIFVLIFVLILNKRLTNLKEIIGVCFVVVGTTILSFKR